MANIFQYSPSPSISPSFTYLHARYIRMRNNNAASPYGLAHLNMKAIVCCCFALYAGFYVHLIHAVFPGFFLLLPI